MLDVSGAGIMMMTAARNGGIVCATDRRAQQIEDLQATLGVGPCIDAIASGGPVLIPDLNDPGDVDVNRWPSFDDVRRSGVQAVFAFPLQVGTVTLGALDLYRDRPGGLSAAQLSAALLAADVAAITLVHMRSASDDVFDTDPATGADYRLQVHQAAGMVAAQLDVDLAEAMLRLRGRAFADGRSLAEIGDDVVARRIRFTPEDL
jgi:hypothetical protein